jgi:uncharacterized peroxidase-related enzyme
MPRLHVVTPEEATGKAEELYDGVKMKMGKVVNIFQGMANSPAALKAYLSMSAALAEGELSPAEREIVYLAVSEHNGCHYCVSAHSMVAKKAGLTDEAILAARRFDAPTEKESALLHFIRRVIETRGFVSDEELASVRNAGYSDGQIAEAIGYIGLATFSNLFNHVHDTPLDFPAAPTLS